MRYSRENEYTDLNEKKNYYVLDYTNGLAYRLNRECVGPKWEIQISLAAFFKLSWQSDNSIS